MFRSPSPIGVFLSITSFLAVPLLLPSGASAEEGMWLFSDPPVEMLQEKYDFVPTPQWLEHLRKSSVRFNNGGSGSFVSSDGLVMTNHHVALGAIQKLSTAERNLSEEGYLAGAIEEELKCHNLELNVLVGIEDVTERVRAAVREGMSADRAHRARRAVINTIQKESLEETGLRSDVVTLFGGGAYHLYRYKKYTDVRLVFAPEGAIAFFGGDVDNFDYPRWCLDVTFFRVYENGKPAKPPHFLQWGEEGVSRDELVFVSGHPGRTEREFTVEHLENLRDFEIPRRLNRYRRQEILYQTFSDQNPENARIAHRDLRGVANGRKAYLGVLAGLQTPALMAKKRGQQEKLRRALAENPPLQTQYGTAWEEIETALAEKKKIYDPTRMWEFAQGFSGSLFHHARTLVRAAQEREKPNAERIPAYSEAHLESLKQGLFSTEPIYHELEKVKLADSLSYLMETLGGDHPRVVEVMAGRSPDARAEQLISGTRLDDVAFRRSLFEGGIEAIEASDDPLIVLARQIDPWARSYRERYEQVVSEPMRQAYEKIADVRFAFAEKKDDPDATFTLRLAFGQVKGYEEDNGEFIPPWTTMGGAYRHARAHHDRPPFRLPESCRVHRDQLDLDTPMNFICTCDIIGGNSGSPVVNRRGEVVGLIFDGNPQSLSWKHVYDDRQGRAVAVDVRAIEEALRKIYSAPFLADSLGK